MNMVRNKADNSGQIQAHSSSGFPGHEPSIALVGCGAIAEMLFLPALAKHIDTARSLTLVDLDTQRAQVLAERFGAKGISTDYRKVIDDVDGAIIALPTLLHYPVAMDFLAHKVHVLCEKPLAEDARKASELVNRAQHMGVCLATNYSQRLWPQFAKVKELIDSGDLGSPVRIEYLVGEPFDWPTLSGFYFNTDRSGRGVLRDRGAHVIDHICWWLGGRPSLVRCQNDAFGGSDAVAHVDFRHGNCCGQIKLSWLSKYPCVFHVEFERGWIKGEVSYPQSVLVSANGQKPKQVKLKSEPYVALGHRIVTNFIGAIYGKEVPLVPGCSVLDSISFIDECYTNATRFAMPWYAFLENNNGEAQWTTES